MSEDTPLKRCSRGELCVHPDGCWQPASRDHFHKNGTGLKSICKACCLESAKRARQEDPEMNRAKYRKYYHKNKEAKRANNKAWRERNKDELNARRRAKYAANPQTYRDAQKRIYHLDDEKARKKARAKHARYRDKRAAYNSSYRVIRLGREKAAYGSFTSADIQAQRKAQTDRKGILRCWWCGKPINGTYHIDHRIPLVRGGSNAPENLCISCPVCNLSKGSKLPGEWKDRLL